MLRCEHMRQYYRAAKWCFIGPARHLLSVNGRLIRHYQCGARTCDGEHVARVWRSGPNGREAVLAYVVVRAHRAGKHVTAVRWLLRGREFILCGEKRLLGMYQQ